MFFSLNNISLKLRGGDLYLIKDFSFSPGKNNRKIAIIGEEGDGKSSLLKVIYDESLVSDYADISGKIVRNNIKFAYLPQKIGNDFFDYDASTYLWLKFKEKLDYDLLYSALAKFDFPPDILESKQKLNTLSGGEKIKFALLCLILSEADCYLLDEPTNDLDFKSLDMMKKFINEEGRSKMIIYISHDVNLLRETADSIIHIERPVHKRENIVTFASCSYDEYVENRENNISRQNRLAKQEKSKLDDKMRKLQKQKSRLKFCLDNTNSPEDGRIMAKKMKSIKSLEKKYAKDEEKMTKKRIEEQAIGLYIPEEAQVHSNKIILDFHLDNLTAGGKILSHNIDLLIKGNEKVCIVGSNGAGKTTLLKYINDYLEKKDPNFKYAYMPQNYEESLDDSEAVYEYLMEGSKFTRSEVMTYLGNMNFLEKEMTDKIGKLSLGQKGKICLAKAIFLGRDFLILDEASRNLSPMSKPELISCLKEYNGAILAASHDKDFIEQVFDKVYILNQDGLSEAEDFSLQGDD